MTKIWGEMTPGERNQAVARALGWTYEPPTRMGWTGYWVATDGQRYISEDLPDFIGSLDACCIVEDEIERRGLVEPYQNALIKILDLDMQVFDSAIELDSWQAPEVPGNRFEWEGHASLWLYSRAMPDRRCQAAVEVLSKGDDAGEQA